MVMLMLLYVDRYTQHAPSHESYQRQTDKPQRDPGDPEGGIHERSAYLRQVNPTFALRSFFVLTVIAEIHPFY